jgi:hypothetical protein
MRTRGLLIALLAAAAVGTAVLAAQSRYPGVIAQAPAEAWEYMVVSEPTPASGSSLNRLGQNGWELVSALTQTEHSGNTSRTNTHFFLKRRLRQPAQPQ